MELNIESLKLVCPCSESPAEKVVYSTDSSCMQGELLAVTWPENLEQLQKLIRFATREKVSLIPRGGGTSLVGGCVPQSSIVVDMSRLNKIKRLILEEKTVIAEAGVYLDNLNNSLSKYNLEFPIKPGSHAGCTIGGMIATNAAGLLSKKFGKVDGWVSEITFMDGTGKLFTFEGNEAKKLAGSEGTCGFIVEAKLKLLEISENFSSDLFEFENLQGMSEKLNALKNDDAAIAIEYINPIASKLVGMTAKEHLLVKYSNDKGKLDIDEASKVWKMRENLYSVIFNAGFTKIEDPFFEEGVERFLDWINKQNVPAYGHIGYGIIHPHFRREEDIERMNNAVKELHGQLAGEHGIGLLKKKYAPLGITTRIKEIKAAYDPSNIMNRGKVI
ncbi:MAG: FAD-binding oxidoreductase [Nanoarchaeota archaeon]|nr:FAD-binding oxidoreductase [Nanoarchaeota archaeon]